MGVNIADIVSVATKPLVPLGLTLSDTWAALIGDRVATWRLTNAAHLQAAAKVQMQALGLKLDHSKVPERYALAWFEEATKQDEPELHELFARLLARAAAGDDDALDRRHLEILTHLTPQDAEVFRWFVEDVASSPFSWEEEYKVWSRVKKELGEGSWMSIEHLMALGVIERRFDSVKKDEDYNGESWTALSELTATERGMSLYRACVRIAG